MTDYPVDSTIRPCCKGIGRHTPACERAVVDLGPAASPPSWVTEGARGEWDSHQGRAVCQWERDLGGVLITCSDVLRAQRWVRTSPVVIVGDQELTAVQARSLAAELIAAVELLDGAR